MKAKKTIKVVEIKNSKSSFEDAKKFLKSQLSLPVGCVVWDKDLRAVSWDCAAEKIFGFSEKEVLGLTAYKLIVPKNIQPLTDKVWHGLLKGTKVVKSINKNITKDGKIILCEWINFPLKDNNGNVFGILSVVQNITNRKKMEQEINFTLDELSQKNKILEDIKNSLIDVMKDLNQNKAQDEAILSSIGEGTVATDRNGKVIFLNKAAMNTLGWSLNEIIDKQWTDFMTIEDGEGKPIPLNKRPIYLALKYGKTINTDKYYYIRKNKTKFPVVITAAPIILNKKTIGVVVVFRDITREKEIDKAKTEFVSLASHQLRTPLSTINWYTEMLFEKDKENKEKEKKEEEYLKEIYYSNQRMIKLVNALLNVSRIEMGTFSINPKKFMLIEVINRILKELAPKILEKKIEIIKKIQYSSTVNIDPELINIVIFNLLDNAITYTPENGKVFFELAKNNDGFLITIKDNGIGIPKNQQSKIFTKLFRADNAIEKQTGGAGLGLYITKSIVENSGGRIWFKSPVFKKAPKERQGTIFYVAIPLIGMKKKVGSKSLS